jgi:hypothetical protein
MLPPKGATKAERLKTINDMILTAAHAIGEARACPATGYIFAWDHALAVKHEPGMEKPIVVTPARATVFPARTRALYYNGREKLAVLVQRKTALESHIKSSQELMLQMCDMYAVIMAEPDA